VALTDDESTAILRPMWEALVTEAEARLFRVLDYHTSGGLRIILDRTEGTLPPNARGTIEDISVLVDFPAYSLAQELQTLLGQIIADLGDAADPATNSPNYVYWVDGAGLAHWPTFNGAVTRWEG
jgi:hypothetical protein